MKCIVEIRGQSYLRIDFKRHIEIANLNNISPGSAARPHLGSA